MSKRATRVYNVDENVRILVVMTEDGVSMAAYHKDNKSRIPEVAIPPAKWMEAWWQYHNGRVTFN